MARDLNVRCSAFRMVGVPISNDTVLDLLLDAVVRVVDNRVDIHRSWATEDASLRLLSRPSVCNLLSCSVVCSLNIHAMDCHLGLETETARSCSRMDCCLNLHFSSPRKYFWEKGLNTRQRPCYTSGSNEHWGHSLACVVGKVTDRGITK